MQKTHAISLRMYIKATNRFNSFYYKHMWLRSRTAIMYKYMVSNYLQTIYRCYRCVLSNMAFKSTSASF